MKLNLDGLFYRSPKVSAVAATATVGAAVPFIMGAVGPDAVQAAATAANLSWWQLLLVTGVSSGMSAALGLVAYAARKGIGAYFAAKARALLTDKDKGNDALGHGLQGVSDALNNPPNKDDDE